jgi:hypothetical protein
LIALTEFLKLQKSGQFPYEPVKIKKVLGIKSKKIAKTTQHKTTLEITPKRL